MAIDLCAHPTPAPRAFNSISGARPRPPWKTGKKPFPRAPAEDRRKDRRKGAARGGGRRQPRRGTPQRASTPARRPRPGPDPEKKEPSPGCRAATHQRGRRAGRRPGERDSGELESRTQSPGRQHPERHGGLATHSRKQTRAPQQPREGKAQRALAAITPACTPRALIYSSLLAPRDLPSLAPARGPAPDVTHPQAGRARLADELCRGADWCRRS